jgi:glycosyltransferase involved in cell wall biosynthesis
MLPGLSVIIPCFDEEPNVADAVRASLRAAAEFAADYEVVVVDDGSTDGTARVARQFLEADRHVRLIVRAGNGGYGEAVRTGLRAARMPWVLLTDADERFDVEHLEDFVPHARSSDVVVGWRVMRQDPLGRRVRAALWNRLLRRLFKLPVHDVDCAFKLIRRDLLERLELVSSGSMINAELLVRSLAAGGRVAEVPVRDRPLVAGERIAGPTSLLRAFRELIQLHGKLRRVARTPRPGL